MTTITQNACGRVEAKKTSRTLLKRGFTLMELIAVISIMAILALGLGYGFRWASQSAKEAKDKNNITMIQQKMRQYALLNNLDVGDACTKTDLVGSGKPFETEPLDPWGEAYNFGSTVPDYGTPYATGNKNNVPDKVE